MAIVVKPPHSFDTFDKPCIFLAGSIEMGKAQDWQTQFFEACKNDDVVLLNPRRDDWDPTWEQSIDNDNFRGQVEWELKGLESSDVIALYFDPNTQSPISMLELGLFAKSKKLVVCCEEGFWRKGNIDVVCKRYGIEQVTNLVDLIARVRMLTVAK